MIGGSRSRPIPPYGSIRLVNKELFVCTELLERYMKRCLNAIANAAEHLTERDICHRSRFASIVAMKEEQAFNEVSLFTHRGYGRYDSFYRE